MQISPSLSLQLFVFSCLLICQSSVLLHSQIKRSWAQKPIKKIHNWFWFFKKAAYLCTPQRINRIRDLEI